MTTSEELQRVLEVKGLSALTLCALDLDMRAGDRVAIIGESGSGKSVFLRSILGLHRPKKGTVSVFGQVVHGKPLRLQGLGVAFQEPGLFDDRDVAANLEILDDHSMGTQATRSLLDDLGLDGLPLDAPVDRLSGGQRKRISLARALVRGSQFLVLDEPTSGLDPNSSRRVIHTIARHLENPRRTMLLVTHDFGVAVALSTRFYLLTAGRLMAVCIDNSSPVGEKEEALRSSFAPNQRKASPSPATERKPFIQLPSSAGWDLLRGLLIGVPAMVLLGAMLVVHSSTASYIDISRHIPALVVNSVFRELAPLIMGLLLVASTGAKMTTRVAGMSFSAQLDSMRLLGMSTIREILLPNISKALLIFPVSIISGAYAGIVGGTIATFMYPSSLSIGTSRFLILGMENVSSLLVLSLVLKGLFMGCMIACVSFAIGSRPVNSTSGMGDVVTRSSIACAILVILCDVAVSMIVLSGSVL